MGKAKIKKKSTFIDMTAMSDVTVLLLTFFMLTSTFLQKEPTIVYTPSSVSEEKVPTANLMTILVSSANKAPKAGEDPLATEGKIFISFAGDADSTWSSPKVRAMVLQEAVRIYNQQQKDPNKKINLTESQVNTFSQINMMGTPFSHLSDLLKMDISHIDKEQGDLTNPNVGIPINLNNWKIGDLESGKAHYNDFQIWCIATYNTARKIREEKQDKNPDFEGVPDDLLKALMRDGTGIALKADKDTPFTLIDVVFKNLQSVKFNKFSLLTALTSEDEGTAAAPSN